MSHGSLRFVTPALPGKAAALSFGYIGVLTGLAIFSQWPKVVARRVSGYPFEVLVLQVIRQMVASAVDAAAPDPLNGGVCQFANVPVRWRNTADESMRRVVE